MAQILLVLPVSGTPMYVSVKSLSAGRSFMSVNGLKIHINEDCLNRYPAVILQLKIKTGSNEENL